MQRLGQMVRWSEAQGLSRAIPNPNNDAVPASSGFPIADVSGIRVWIQTIPTTGTLTGGATGGWLRCWFYRAALGLWVQNPDLDKAVNNGASGVIAGLKVQVFPDDPVWVPSPGDRALFAADTVTGANGITGLTVGADAIL